MKSHDVAPRWGAPTRSERLYKISQGCLFILANVDAEDESVQWPGGMWEKPLVAMMEVRAIMKLYPR